MSEDTGGQDRYDVRCGWGRVAAIRLGSPEGVTVIVDVLSFTTTVSVAVDRGAAVYPVPRRDSSAAQLAHDIDAVLVFGRREVTAAHPWSLSPASLTTSSVPPRLVVASPNGATIAACARGVVVAACLRNAGAVGTWLGRRYGGSETPITVIAAGERWPDGSLRPALEDWLGVGAVIASLAERGDASLSPDAEAARATYDAMREGVPEAIRRCDSGVELTQAGFGADVELAAAVDVSDAVPVLTDGAFRAAHGGGRHGY